MRATRACQEFCVWGMNTPHVMPVVRQKTVRTSSAPLAGTRIDRQRGLPTCTRSDFERGPSEQTQLIPPASRQAHVVHLRGLTIVAMMQAADLRRDDDLAGGTHRPAVRGVFTQAEMRAAPMVVGEIRAQAGGGDAWG
jgi:hypothetical protein